MLAIEVQELYPGMYKCIIDFNRFFYCTIIVQVKIREVDKHVQYTFHATVRRLTILNISHPMLCDLSELECEVSFTLAVRFQPGCDTDLIQAGFGCHCKPGLIRSHNGLFPWST